MALPEVKVRITADDSGLNRGLNRATKALAGFAAKATAGTITAVAGVATGFVLATRNAINFADEMTKTSQKIGLTTESLSKLQYAAKLSGVSISDLRVGLSQLARNMVENSDAFEQLGIAVRNQDGTLRSTESVLMDLADRFAQMPDGAQKTAAAMELLGRSGANMIPFFNAGAAGIKNLTEEARIFGIEVSSKAGKQAEQFNDNLTRLATAFQGLATRVAEHILPSLVEFTDQMVEMVKNEPAMRNAARTIADAFIQIGSAIKTALPLLTDFIRDIRTIGTLYAYLGDESVSVGDKIKASLFGVPESWIKAREELEKYATASKNLMDDPRLGGQPLDAGTVVPSGQQAAAPTSPISGEMLDRTARLGEQVKAEYALLGERIEFLRENFMTEQELLQSKYDQDLAMLDEYYRNKSDKDGQYADMRYRLEEQLKRDLEKLEKTKMQNAFESAGMLFGGLAQLAQVGGRKLFNVAKSFALAEAVMNTAQAVTKTYTTTPYPFNIPAAIGQAAAGAAQIATIASTQPGGGGGGIKAPSSGGGAGAAAAPAAAAPAAAGGRPTQVALQLTGGDLFGRDQVISLINAINEAQEDGAVVRLV